jgi:hypothetical protein
MTKAFDRSIGKPWTNYIINGAMMVSQENGDAAGSVSQYYAADQFANGTITSGTYTVQRVASVTPGGSPYRFRVTVTGADATVDAGDVFYIWQRLEGLRVANLQFGTSSAKTITLRFGVRGPAGTYSVVLSNGNLFTRSRVETFVIPVSNVDTVISITIPGDTTGTWPKDNTCGINVFWGLVAGANSAKAPGAWGSDSVAITGATGQFNFMGTVGNVFELFDVGLYEGTAAPTFQVPDYGDEITKCQRYWQRQFGSFRGAAGSDGVVGNHIYFVPYMRATPTCTFTDGPVLSAAGRFLNFGGFTTAAGTGAQFNIGAGANYYNFGFTMVANARM